MVKKPLAYNQGFFVGGWGGPRAREGVVSPNTANALDAVLCWGALTRISSADACAFFYLEEIHYFYLVIKQYNYEPD
jgi:hypothetical protein